MTFPFAVSFKPVLGYSKSTDILQNGWERTRDVGVRCPKVFTPLKAHEVDASDEQFPGHDTQHIAIAMMIPDQHKRLFMMIANYFRSQKDPILREVGFNYFVDLDAVNSYYRKRYTLSWLRKFKDHVRTGMEQIVSSIPELKPEHLETISHVAAIEPSA